MADPISNLVSQLCRLPGVGTKSAQRLAYFILDMPESEAREIAKAINDARDKIHHCPVCGNYTDTDPCAICRDASRKTGVICVVRDARDVVACCIFCACFISCCIFAPPIPGKPPFAINIPPGFYLCNSIT